MTFALLPRFSAAMLAGVLLLCSTPCDAHAKAPQNAKPDAAAELQTLVFGLADRYVQGYAELLTELAADDSTPAPLRLTVQLEKVHTASAVYSLAAGPSPEAALLDLMALSTLRRLQLEKNLETRFGRDTAAHAARLVTFSQTAEQEIWSAGARYLSKEQANELRRLAEVWFAENADLEFSSLVHFHDFYAASTASTLAEVMRGSSRGMLGPLRDAVASIDEARLVSERAMYLSVRLPLLARWQAEALAYRALTLPEARELLGAAGTLSSAATDMVRQLDALPEKLTEQRRAILQGASDLAGEAGRVVAEAREAVATAQPLIAEARVTGELARATSTDLRAALETLAAIQQTHAASPVGRMTPEQVSGALQELRQTAATSLELVRALQDTVASLETARPMLTDVLAASEASARRTIDQAAWRAAQVIGGALLLWGAIAWSLRFKSAR